jgi:hypothetical protein
MAFHQLRSLRTAAFLAAFPLMVATARGQLQWSAKTITRQAGVGDKVVEVVYPFRNAGTVPVKILSVNSRCGCTTAGLAKDDYAPGESGEIKVVFDLGDRSGYQEKPIWVTTSDRPSEAVELKLIVDIPQWLTIEPRLVCWEVGGSAEEKCVTLTVHPAAKVEISRIQATSDKVAHRLETVPSLGYRLYLKPVGTANKFKATFLIRAGLPGQVPRTFMVFAQVR